ncbi:MAG: c-type cytochrome biogenesis protein CcsB [Gammaproteobacteria bacterium]|nr:c-type cytochrome biogenesis protein CcsB [Gammaproteobacteria bacterium]
MSVTESQNFGELEKPGILSRINTKDWAWFGLLVIACVATLTFYGAMMDVYEKGILIGVALLTAFVGWYWKSSVTYAVSVAVFSLFSIWLYGDSLAAGEQNFFLKFLLSSQSAFAWMGALFFLATAAYFLGLFANSEFALNVASRMTWIAAGFGFVGLMVRWRESYLFNPEYGHIPVSNLYEVFIMFCIITALMYLYYEKLYKNKNMGGFVLLVISAAVGFIYWYASKGAADIKPLVPALQSYWMKIHVPANFVGYGAFAMSAMLAIAYLIKEKFADNSVVKRIPDLQIIDDIMYKAIALGFAFFTIATILGAMWAAEAWGGYWSWDPKETWALIVWLNYAAWLHMRLTKGWRGAPMAWWSIIGLFVTLFAFLGVNMFLSGLHSYGEL